MFRFVKVIIEFCTAGVAPSKKCDRMAWKYPGETGMKVRKLFNFRDGNGA